MTQCVKEGSRSNLLLTMDEHTRVITRMYRRHAFLEATKNFDDSFMNFCLGSVMDYVARQKPGQVVDRPGELYLSAVFKRQQLLYVFVSNRNAALAIRIGG